MIEADNKTIYLEDKEAKVSLKVKQPPNFYKYYSLSKYSVENLKNHKIHFSHPYNLNDIMDGNLQLWDLEDFYQDFLKKSKIQMDEFTFGKEIVQKHSFEYYKHRGVLCLTESFNNKLFWPHYTSEQGFCLEFESDKFLESFSKEEVLIFPISYEPLKKINFNKYIEKEIVDGKANINAKLPLLYALSYKDSIWEYEKEWRILLRKKNLGEVSHPLNPISDEKFKEENENLKLRNISFAKNSISKIILSNLFFHKNRFNSQFRKEGIDTYTFRDNEMNDDSILYQFLNLIRSQHNDKIYQLDRDFDKANNHFLGKLYYKIKILELDFQKIVIERTLNSG